MNLDIRDEASLLAAFSGLKALLILDNCDPVEKECPWLETLLRFAPDLTLVATTRRALRLASEQVFWLDGLVTPDEVALNVATYREGRGVDCVQLFVTAARRARPDWQVREEDLPQIVAICRALGGLPLAVLLAAKWVSRFTLAQIRQLVTEEMPAALSFLDRDAENGRLMTVTFEQTCSAWNRVCSRRCWV